MIHCCRSQSCHQHISFVLICWVFVVYDMLMYTFYKALLKKEPIDLLVPCSRCLIGAIESFLQFVQAIFLAFFIKTWWLSHIWLCVFFDWRINYCIKTNILTSFIYLSYTNMHAWRHIQYTNCSFINSLVIIKT